MAGSGKAFSTISENPADVISGLGNSIGIVLAAGQGKRMKTSLPKVAHTILGKPLIIWAADSLLEAGVRRVVLVISPNQHEVEKIVRAWPFPADATVEIAYQDEAKGTGHAAACALPTVRRILEKDGVPASEAQVIIGFGDTPAVASSSFSAYFSHHISKGNDCTVLAFDTENPTGYGRVVTDPAGRFLAIREDKDCSATEKQIRVCNSGFLCAALPLLEETLPLLRTNNAAGEYYLTDVPRIASECSKKVGVYTGIARDELEGVNSQRQLADLSKFIQRRIVDHWLASGVQFLDPEAVYLEPGVTFDADVIVEPFVYLAGKAHVARGTRIHAGSRLVDGKRT